MALKLIVAKTSLCDIIFVRTYICVGGILTKILARSIDVICDFTPEEIKPIRFKINGDKNEKIISVDRVLKLETEKLGGNPMQAFICESNNKGSLWDYELKLECRTCKWMLFRIWRH